MKRVGLVNPTARITEPFGADILSDQFERTTRHRSQPGLESREGWLGDPPAA